jgi:hypothetical protein
MPWIPCQVDWKNSGFWGLALKCAGRWWEPFYTSCALYYLTPPLYPNGKQVVVRLKDSIMRISKHLLFIIFSFSNVFQNWTDEWRDFSRKARKKPINVFISRNEINNDIIIRLKWTMHYQMERIHFIKDW